MDRIETTYNKILNRFFQFANPIKKSILHTECKVHIFINQHSLDVLLCSKYLKEYNFFKSYLENINEGAVWADQDFKSSSHFYNPYKKRGLYGRKSAIDLTNEYYIKSINQWRYGNKNKAMFYLGAAVHIVQDMTVPQHANIRLLDDHHQYESFVKKVYQDLEGYCIQTTPYFLDSIGDYVRFNTRVALKVHRRFKVIRGTECKYVRTIRCTLPLAIRTSAGVLLLYYNEVSKDNIK